MLDRMATVVASAVLAMVGAASHAADDVPVGYLSAGEFDATSVIEPAPRPGDPRYDADRKIFRATRRLSGSPRWELAKKDAETSVPAMLRTFSCAVGVALTPENAPKFVSVARRAARDTSQQTSIAKEAHQRQRPFTIDKGVVCQSPSELYEKKAQRLSYDYPSGHAAYGWTWAIVLSSMAPDRAQQILERARAYGESRFVCGVHNESAVEAGMVLASATMVVVATKPEYQADLAAAREELQALRASAPSAQNCEVESAILSERVMPKLERKTKR